MIQELSAFSVQFGVLIPVIMALVKAIKMTGLQSRFLPVVAVILGVLAGYFYIGQTTIGVLMGIVAGLSAVGLHGGVKASANLN